MTERINRKKNTQIFLPPPFGVWWGITPFALQKRQLDHKNMKKMGTAARGVMREEEEDGVSCEKGIGDWGLGVGHDRTASPQPYREHRAEIIMITGNIHYNPRKGTTLMRKPY
jgi:hypothetical protein